MGITVALDDFGTGYSSLNYLHSLPITTMKIDKSFIDHVCDTTSSTLELVRIIVSLASSMKLQVVAEGVETLEQCKVLQEMNCTLCQGYFFSRPLPDADFSELLRQGGQGGRWSGTGLFKVF
jgi:EAL domain-containing protein (putative c-di-GMP-specific phosphodiesterase class I)